MRPCPPCPHLWVPSGPAHHRCPPHTDTLCNELDQERKARYAIQQKLKGTGRISGGSGGLSGARGSRGDTGVTAGHGGDSSVPCRGSRRAASLLVQDADPAALHGELLLQAAAAAPVSPPRAPHPRSHAGRAHTSHSHQETPVQRGLGARLCSERRQRGRGPGGSRLPAGPPPLRLPLPPCVSASSTLVQTGNKSGYVQWIINVL